MKKNKLLLIGWDGADWKIIGPLLAQGKMPALKHVLQNGVYANMATMNPPYSPMLWTSVATGKTPDKHGILDFLEIDENLNGIRPVTCKSRKSRAIWNILHNQGFKSNLVGWWPSYPAEPINGVIVSDKFQKIGFVPNKKDFNIGKDVIHPQELTSEFQKLKMFTHEITDAHILPFFPKAAEIDQKKNRSLNSFAKVTAENVSVHNAATRLLRTTDWDFMGVYYDYIDHLCHSFMKFHPPQLKGVPDDLFEIFKDGINSAYRFQDMMLARKLELIDDQTTVIIMSDHGYESGDKRIISMPKGVHAAPAMEHREYGFFAAMGPNIKKGEKIHNLNLIDIAPTILHHFNLPVGKDMDGKVAVQIFKNQKKIEYIESWEAAEGDFGELDINLKEDELTNKETLEQLIELGYIDKLDNDTEKQITKTKNNRTHNLAKVFIGKKDFYGAKELLLELVKQKDSINLASWYLDLLNVYIKIEDFNEAEITLNKLREVDEKFKTTTYYAEAEILIGKKKYKKAIHLLNKARENNPQAGIWFLIGKAYRRLTSFNDAINAFHEAIKLNSDNAAYHRALAESYLRVGEFEEAADYALTSIELNKFFPAAHYTLGEALEKLGDLDNAKIAYETASRLKPVKYDRAEKAIENILEKEKAAKTNKSTFKRWDDQIVVVSGLPRSGTSLMMQMLNKGGYDVLTDKKRTADESNPKGYFEYEAVKSLNKDNSWLEKAQNKALKIVAPMLRFVDLRYRYKVIFMERDLNEVIKSQRKMLGKDPETLPIPLMNSFTRMLNNIGVWKDKEPSVELIYVNYSELIQNPKSTIKMINDFLGENLNLEAMESAIDPALYRNKESVKQKL